MDELECLWDCLIESFKMGSRQVLSHEIPLCGTGELCGEAKGGNFLFRGTGHSLLSTSSVLLAWTTDKGY